MKRNLFLGALGSVAIAMGLRRAPVEAAAPGRPLAVMLDGSEVPDTWRPFYAALLDECKRIAALHEVPNRYGFPLDGEGFFLVKWAEDRHWVEPETRKHRVMWTTRLCGPIPYDNAEWLWKATPEERRGWRKRAYVQFLPVDFERNIEGTPSTYYYSTLIWDPSIPLGEPGWYTPKIHDMPEGLWNFQQQSKHVIVVPTTL